MSTPPTITERVTVLEGQVAELQNEIAALSCVCPLLEQILASSLRIEKLLGGEKPTAPASIGVEYKFHY
jgi:hypothetical protein